VKKSLLFILLLSLPTIIQAQTEEAQVTEVVNRLFTAMAKSDSTMLRSVFSKEVTMATISRNKEMHQIFTRENSINDFATSVGKTQPGMLAEEIWNLKIQMDGDFAQAWCEYAFYYQNKFSHCGVDAFHLIKTTEGWKIFHLADTRRKENCIIPEEIKNKHK
jgi:hypothetical protein